MTASCPDEDGYSSSMVIGIILSVIADTIISVSLSVTKLAHMRNEDPETGKPVKAYIKVPLWWLGIILNAGGELGNLFAYGFAPASVVTPVGSVGVLCNAFLATWFLKEPLTKRNLVGMFTIICGVVLIVLGVPEAPVDLTVDTITNDVLAHPRAYGYLIFLFCCILLLRFLAPRYGDKYILVYLMLCSLISSITVIAARSFSSMLTSMLEGCDDGEEYCDTFTDVVSAPLFWVCLLVIVITAIWSVKYLNNAMMLYGNNQVVPLYYCTFTMSSVVGAAIVYDEMRCIRLKTGLMFGFGCAAAFIGVLLVAGGSKGAGEAESGSAEATHENAGQNHPRKKKRRRARSCSNDALVEEGQYDGSRPDTPSHEGSAAAVSAGRQLRDSFRKHRPAPKLDVKFAHSMVTSDTSSPSSSKSPSPVVKTACTVHAENLSGATAAAPPADAAEADMTPDYFERPYSFPELGAAIYDEIGAALPEIGVQLGDKAAGIGEKLRSTFGLDLAQTDGSMSSTGGCSTGSTPRSGRNTAAVERARKHRAERRCTRTRTGGADAHSQGGGAALAASAPPAASASSAGCAAQAASETKV